MIDKEIIGERLRDLRGSRTQKEVANACNISIAALAMYETGQRIPRDEVKVRLAKYYHCRVQDIFFTP